MSETNSVMEVDQMSYIFGSFSRRRQAEEGGSAKRRSLSGGAARGRASPGTAGAQPEPAAEGSEEQFTCAVCRHPYVEPRVLPCLHTFCTRCLQGLRPPEEAGGGEDGSDVSLNDKTEVSGSRSGSGSASASGSAGSGYESEQRDTSSDGSWGKGKVDRRRSPRHYVTYAIKEVQGRNGSGSGRVWCPVCGAACTLGPLGVAGLPPHFLLQHKMLVAALRSDPSRLLCDLCAEDVPALTRCTTCLISLCGGCGPAHARQGLGVGGGPGQGPGATMRHPVLSLAEAARRGALTLRRQPLCATHPDNELKLFCSTCCQVICRDCCLMLHSGHAFEPVSRAAESYIRSIREAVARVKPVARQTATALERLHNDGKRMQIKSGVVHEDVEQFIDSYIKAVEEHRQTLQLQVLKACDVKMQAITSHQLELEKRAENVNDAVKFAEDILSEGTDVEVLSFVGPLLRRLEWCSDTEGLIESRVSDNLELLKEEKAGKYRNFQLYGVISTQCVDPNMCVINPEGFRGIKMLQPHELVLETRDSSGQPLCGGGARVWGALRRPGVRPRSISTQDRRDGTYLLTFVPDAVGTFQLAVLVNGKPIKNSPFRLISREVRPHLGKYHCCSFCSSGGNRAALCVCDGAGRMGGGYRGCGHGHPGHPGTRHWSCCAASDQHAECTSTGTYQFSL